MDTIAEAFSDRLDALIHPDNAFTQARQFYRRNADFAEAISGTSDRKSLAYQAALRNVDWALPVTAGSDAHDVWYLGSAVTRFAGRSAIELRRALAAGRTRAHREWAWTADKMPRHVRIQTRSLLRFLMLCRQRRRVASTS